MVATARIQHTRTLLQLQLMLMLVLLLARSI
jgi:hypothetical protein